DWCELDCNQCGELEPVILQASVAILCATTTFSRFIPSMKALDYEAMIFILTFCFVSVSVYRVDKASAEAMANLARWEPAHGRFKFRNPWKQYLRVGTSMRNYAYCIKTLNGFITSEVQDSKWMILHSKGTGFAKEASQRSTHDANLAMCVNAPVALRLLNKAGDMPSLECLEDKNIRTMVLQHACAFVTYTTREAAKKAVDELSNKVVIAFV
ncbi:aluminum-activated malate transporter 10-like protein, partial [Tanacetum coccineum]